MSAKALVPVRVIAFPGAPNLPIFAALEQRCFETVGIEATLTTTPNSTYQAEQMAAGAFDIAFTAFDNVVAYTEGQGAVDLGGDPGFRVIMGATQLALALVTAPEIRSIADLKGKSIALDALSTGFAYVLYDMLERAGLALADCHFAPVGATPARWQAVKAGEHAATITIEPFTSIAQRAGFNVLSLSSDIYPSYQGGVVAARRAWSAQNEATVKAFIRAYLRGLSWTLAPENRQAAEELLLMKMPEIQPQAAAAVMRSLLSPRSGLTPEAAVLKEGMKEVLKLRSRYGRGGKILTDVEKYLDLASYDAVRAGS